MKRAVADCLSELLVVDRWKFVAVVADSHWKASAPAGKASPVAVPLQLEPAVALLSAVEAA